jgi:hypothetical protein
MRPLAPDENTAVARQKHGIATIREEFGNDIKRLVKEAEALALVVADEDPRRRLL